MAVKILNRFLHPIQARRCLPTAVDRCFGVFSCFFNAPKWIKSHMSGARSSYFLLLFSTSWHFPSQHLPKTGLPPNPGGARVWRVVPPFYNLSTRLYIRMGTKWISQGSGGPYPPSQPDQVAPGGLGEGRHSPSRWRQFAHSNVAGLGGGHLRRAGVATRPTPRPREGGFLLGGVGTSGDVDSVTTPWGRRGRERSHRYCHGRRAGRRSPPR